MWVLSVLVSHFIDVSHWVSDNQSQHSPLGPLGGGIRKVDEGDKHDEEPPRANRSGKNPLIPLVGSIRKREIEDDGENAARNRKQIGLNSRVAERPKSEGKVRANCTGSDKHGETEEVERPKVKVAERTPEVNVRETLAVVHCWLVSMKVASQ